MSFLYLYFLKISCSENTIFDIENYLENSEFYDESFGNLIANFNKDLPSTEGSFSENDDIIPSIFFDYPMRTGSSEVYSSPFSKSELDFYESLKDNKNFENAEFNPEMMLSPKTDKNNMQNSKSTEFSYNLVEKLDFYTIYLSEISYNWKMSNSYPYIVNNAGLLEINIDKPEINWKDSLDRFRSEFHKHRSTTWNESVFSELLIFETFIGNLLKLIDCVKLYDMGSYSPDLYIEYNNRTIELIKNVFINIPYKDFTSNLYKTVEKYPTLSMSILSLELFFSQLPTFGKIMILHLESINAYINYNNNKLN